jgi:hypothetical protein
MDNLNKKDEQRPRRKRIKSKHTTSSPGENFNTDDHQDPSTRGVGPGYDDTGSGNDEQASRLDEKKEDRQE